MNIFGTVASPEHCWIFPDWKNIVIFKCYW